MQQVITIMGPIFIIISLGFWVTQRQWVEKSVIRALGLFVINFALPSMVFLALTKQDFIEVVNLNYLLAYGGGALAAMLLVLLFSLYITRTPFTLSALFSLGASLPNNAFIGFPVVSQLLGAKAGIALAMCMLIENAVLLPLALILLESHTHAGKKGYIKQIFIRLVSSPLIVAIAMGMLFSLLHIPIPNVLHKVLELLGQASVGISLFVIGGSLVGLKTRGVVWQVSPVIVGKLILHPLITFLLLTFLLPMPAWLQVAAVLFSCSPMFSIYPIFGQKYGQEGVCAAALLLTTLLSFFTISLMLWWQGQGGF